MTLIIANKIIPFQPRWTAEAAISDEDKQTLLRVIRHLWINEIVSRLARFAQDAEPSTLESTILVEAARLESSDSILSEIDTEDEIDKIIREEAKLLGSENINAIMEARFLASEKLLARYGEGNPSRG